MFMRLPLLTGTLTGVALALPLAASAATLAPGSIVLNFEVDADGDPIAHGQIIDNEYAAWGITIAVQHPSNASLDFGIALNTQISKEADMRTSPGFGAYHPTNNKFLGNVLISPRNGIDANNDGIIDVPDTAFERPNGTFTFTLREAWLSGSVTILDAEEAGGYIHAFLNGSLTGAVSIPAVGDNSVIVLDLPQGPFNELVIRLGGSGGLDNLTLNPIPEPGAAALLAGAGLLAARRRRA
jgi:hypothetical protein